ncbi:hypothetical protein UFOVP1311_59 [uncultured Caudovirales phage]|jgi:hypothetical protein|uniref:Uncharacterized protein n=1 Tax=uncultured Caudovirales phage TaxID=2100421 RepID=A0A6J5RL55_9CAUD|nr:hypothetical protein UFOVP1311_59 [uncultured Caudovirales phage]
MQRKIFISCSGSSLDEEYTRLVFDLEKYAKLQKRSKSNLIKLILTEYFKDKNL